MIPFLHLGPLTIPTFGLMVAAGLLVSAYVLQADFDRRRDTFLKSGYLKESNEPSDHDEGFLVIGIAGLSGLVGARLYHVLESLRELMSIPSLLVSRFGFAWFGGFLGGLLALIFRAKYFALILFRPVLRGSESNSSASIRSLFWACPTRRQRALSRYF